MNIHVFGRIFPFHFHHPFAYKFAVSISSQHEKRLFCHIRKNTEEMRKSQNRPKALYFQGFSDNLMFCLKAAEKQKPSLWSKKIQICASFYEMCDKKSPPPKSFSLTSATEILKGETYKSGDISATAFAKGNYFIFFFLLMNIVTPQPTATINITVPLPIAELQPLFSLSSDGLSVSVALSASVGFSVSPGVSVPL